MGTDRRIRNHGYGSAVSDPYRNVTDPRHWMEVLPSGFADLGPVEAETF
jgi:hypothetical protein